MDKLEWQWVVVGVLGGQVAGLGVLVIATSYWQALASMALLGIAFGAAISLRPLLVGVLFGTRAFGSVLGLLQSASIATGVLGPIILGGVFDRYDTYTPALIGFSVLSAARESPSLSSPVGTAPALPGHVQHRNPKGVRNCTAATSPIPPRTTANGSNGPGGRVWRSGSRSM